MKATFKMPALHVGPVANLGDLEVAAKQMGAILAATAEACGGGNVMAMVPAMIGAIATVCSSTTRADFLFDLAINSLTKTRDEMRKAGKGGRS